jgi:hypothetical protein
MVTLADRVEWLRVVLPISETVTVTNPRVEASLRAAAMEAKVHPAVARMEGRAVIRRAAAMEVEANVKWGIAAPKIRRRTSRGNAVVAHPTSTPTAI